MADRSISVKLRAEVDQYKRSMDEAARATEKVGTSAEGTSKKADGALSRMMQSAQQNREAWSTVGTTLVAAGGAVTAFGVAALKTGIEYNTLQQTSRAALTSLLGSARAANAQMDKLDAFAKTSPFSKSTFIQAQQQMLAFGIETRKVIPYLDAVQNAVAAAGGSNQDIAEIVATMSKVQSSAKITAEDLNELGNRGVNAAELIGSQMGMTGAEIREAISSGSLDATQALDALAAGMSERFAGAADNVKNTFAGATDRVKAAWRDFSSELATPLVNPEGGGALVDFLNGLADAMRGFSKLPEPVKNSVTALAGIGGVTALAAGGLLLLVPRIADTVDGFQRFAPAGSKARGALVSVGKAAAAAAIAMTAASTAAIAQDGALKNMASGTTVRALTDIATGAKSTKDAFQGMFASKGFSDWFWGNDIKSSQDAVKVLTDPSVSQQIDNTISSIVTLGQSTSTNRKQAEEFFSTIDDGLTQLVSSGNADLAKRALDELGIPIEKQAELLPQYTGALDDAAAKQSQAVESTATLAGWQQRLAEQMASMDPAAKANAEAFAALADSTSNAGSAFLDFSDDLGGAEFSLDGWLTKLEENAAAVSAWSDNIAAIAERGASRQLLAALIEEGPAAAQAVSALASGTEADMARAEAAFAGPTQSLEELQAQLAEKYLLDVDASPATATVFDFAGFYRQTGADLSPWAVNADGTPARTEAEASKNAISDMKPNPFDLRANDRNARVTAQGFVDTNWNTTVDVYANTGPAESRLRSFFDSWSGRSITNYVETVQTQTFRQIFVPPGGYTGGKVGAIAGYYLGGEIDAYAAGGGVPRTPPKRITELDTTEAAA